MSEESVQVEVDADRITIDAFLEMMEIQERIQGEGQPKAADIRSLFEILKGAVVGQDAGKLPYRHLAAILQQVTASFRVGVDPN